MYKNGNLQREEILVNVNKINNAQSLLEAYYKQANATGTQVRMSAENQKIEFCANKVDYKANVENAKGVRIPGVSSDLSHLSIESRRIAQDGISTLQAAEAESLSREIKGASGELNRATRFSASLEKGKKMSEEIDEMRKNALSDLPTHYDSGIMTDINEYWKRLDGTIDTTPDTLESEMSVISAKERIMNIDIAKEMNVDIA